MGKTYSCTLDGCDMVFTRQFQLKKHTATHNDPDSLFRCTACDFYTLDKRNLKTHISQHTGEKNIECPDTIRVRDSPGLPTQEITCPYRTHDRSLLTRHRKKKHAYIPRPRASPQRPTTFTLVSSATTSASTTTGKTTSRVKKPKQVRKQKDVVQRPKTSQARATRKAKNSTSRGAQNSPKLPLTLQEGVDEHGPLANVNPLDAADSGSSGSSSSTSVAPHQGISSDAHGHLTHAESSYAAGHSNIMSVAPHQGISLDAHGQLAHTESLYATSTMPIAPNQGISNAYGHRGYVQSLDAAGYNNTMSIAANQGMSSNARGLPAYTQSPVANTSNSAMLAHAQGQSAYGASQNATGSIFVGFSGTTSVTPNQGISMDVPFGPATNANWSTFHAGGSAAPSVSGTYNPAPNPQMHVFPMSHFQMNNGSPAGMEGWYPSVWNDLWAQYNSF